MSLNDITSGKKLETLYDITTGKKLAKVYQFTPSGYSLVYQMFKKLWETTPEAYQLLNLQTDSTGNLYPILSGLGFHRLQASDGSTLGTGSETSPIIGDLNIDETNAFITYITSGNNWNKFKYSDLSKLVYGESGSSYWINDSTPLAYPVNSYKTTFGNYTNGSGDLLDNSSTTANSWPKLYTETPGVSNSHIMALDGFGSNSSFALGTALAYSASTAKGFYAGTGATYTTSFPAALESATKWQTSPVGYGNVSAYNIVGNFYMIMTGGSVYLVEMYQYNNETYINNIATYTPTNSIVTLINDVNNFDKSITTTTDPALVGDKPAKGFTFYTVEQSNSGGTNNLTQVTFSPGVDTTGEASDASTFKSKVLDSWDSYSGVKGVKKGNQLSVGTSVTIAPYSTTINSTIAQYANAVDSQLVSYWGGNNNTITQLNSDGTERNIYLIATGTTTGGIDVDSKDYVYVGASDGSLYKLDHQLNLIWKKTVDSKINDVSIATGDYIYVGTHNGTIYQFDTDGNIKWTVTLDNIVDDLDVANDGSVYAVSDKSSAYHYDKDGNQLLKYTVPDTSANEGSGKGLNPTRIACTKSGDYFFIGGSDVDYYYVSRISSAGVYQARFTNSYAINSIVCDDNYVYWTIKSTTYSYLRTSLSLGSSNMGATTIGATVNELALDGLGGLYLAVESGIAMRQMTDLSTTTKYASKVLSYQVG